MEGPIKVLIDATSQRWLNLNDHTIDSFHLEKLTII